MSQLKKNLFPLLILLIISVFTVLDLFINVGRSANMDGLAHITTVAQFTNAFRSGDFPVVWLDGFANYGLPVGMLAQQFTSYLGMGFNLMLNDPVLAYNIVAFIGILLSNIFFYYFLRLYFTPLYSLLGTIVFNFAPYRIIDLYIRGAIPETFSTIFLPVVLLSIYYWVQKKSSGAFYVLVLGLLSIILTHPMMLITYSFIIVPYLVFNLFSTSIYKNRKKLLKYILLYLIAVLLALGIAGYYLIPLNLEVKYFYYGSEKNHLVPNQYMSWANYFDPNWYYNYKGDIFSRGHFIKAGLLETIIVILGTLIVIYRVIKGRVQKKLTLLDFSVFSGILIIFFTLPLSDFVYKNVSVLGNIQFPWRMLSVFIFIPPIIITYVLYKTNRNVLVILLILLVCFIRFPQLYGKNYTLYPLSSYTFTPINLHSNNLNTIWTGITDEYPVKKEKIEIIDGQATITEKTIKNSSRSYVMDASTQVRVVDYTFYFPGWKLLIDGKETNIEFQDPAYRGVITYLIPPGKHQVLLQFEDTKIRTLGKIVTVVFACLFIFLFLVRKRLMNLLT